MTIFTNVPKQIEEALGKYANTSRRNFLKQSGLLVVSTGAAMMAGPFTASTLAQAAGQAAVEKL